MKTHEIELFPKKYRKYFSDREVMEKDCPLDRITLKSPYEKTNYRGPNDNFYRYTEDIKSVYADLEKTIYDTILKIVWLEHKFGIDHRKMALYPNDPRLVKALKAFLIRVCMVQKNLFFGPKVGLIPMIRGYAEDFHPGFFDLLDPFKSPIEFPFKTVRLCYISTVSSMDEAIGLLQEAEKQEMDYNEFLDFLANWVACYNEKYGEKYQMKVGVTLGVPAYVNNLLAGHTKSETQLLPK